MKRSLATASVVFFSIFTLTLPLFLVSTAVAAPSRIVGLGFAESGEPYLPKGIASDNDVVTATTLGSDGRPGIVQLKLSSASQVSIPSPAECLSIAITAVSPNGRKIFGACDDGLKNRGFVTSIAGVEFLSPHDNSPIASVCSFDGAVSLGVIPADSKLQTPFKWTEGLGIEALPISDKSVFSFAGLSFSGDVAVGNLDSGAPFVMSSGVISELPFDAQMVGISGNGEFALASVTESFVLERAYRWNHNLGLQSIDSDLSAGLSTHAAAISQDGGAIIGMYRNAVPRAQNHPFIWTERGSFENLFSYLKLPPSHQIYRWRIEELVGLSPDGTALIGIGINPDGNLEGFAITIGERCGRDFNGDGLITASDADAFYDNWSRGETIADLNRDGGVDGGDVECFWRSESDIGG